MFTQKRDKRSKMFLFFWRIPFKDEKESEMRGGDRVVVVERTRVNLSTLLYLLGTDSWFF